MVWDPWMHHDSKPMRHGSRVLGGWPPGSPLHLLFCVNGAQAGLPVFHPMSAGVHIGHFETNLFKSSNKSLFGRVCIQIELAAVFISFLHPIPLVRRAQYVVFIPLRRRMKRTMIGRHSVRLSDRLPLCGAVTSYSSVLTQASAGEGLTFV